MINEIKLNQTKGLKKLLRQGITRPLEKAVFRIGTIGRNEASKNIKNQKLIDTGQLRQSVIFRPLVDRTQGKILVGKEYGIYHEEGTIYIKPRPFFKPMIEKVEKLSSGIIKAEIDKYLKKMT